ncbi:hypothetical protein GCM10025771_06600 [Niveibacterium umoris]|uniref:Uncharacterized protein n=1 Tax=Niveibacterium umoris TaxID=1193620 RepID=A0A840BMC7_9RHOO|nr:hypothetical protein [Niveibacterium umoris]MBB4013793.1 hypothetical protein [Niveibacterium umoris]
MSDTFNPYSPPRSAIEETLGHDNDVVWRQGKVVILRQREHLPHRCIKCNADAPLGAKPVRLYWHAPGWYVLLLINVLIYLVAAMLVRKRASVHIALCERHLKRRFVGRLIGWGGSLSMLLGMVLGISEDVPSAIVVCAIGFFASLVAGVTLARTVYPVRINDLYVKVKGCGSAFVASLPAFPDA